MYSEPKCVYFPYELLHILQNATVTYMDSNGCQSGYPNCLQSAILLNTHAIVGV